MNLYTLAIFLLAEDFDRSQRSDDEIVLWGSDRDGRDGLTKDHTNVIYGDTKSTLRGIIKWPYAMIVQVKR